jgi:two-component sensor histidine kinase
VRASAGDRRPLGLTIVSRLVQQIGGSLEEPPPGSSRFRVTFPLGATAFRAPDPLPGATAGGL